MTLRPGRIASAAEMSLNRFTETLSQAITSWAGAPTSGAILPPMRCGMEIQSAEFQLRMRSWPHSCATTSASRAGVALGSMPSELPSR